MDINALLANQQYIIGADETGWGAGSCELVVCGVKAPPDWRIPGLNDSKKLTSKRRYIMRDILFDLLDRNVITCHLAERSNFIIDKLGPYPALKDAYVEVFHALYSSDSLIVADGTMKFNKLGVDDYEIVSVPKADGTYPAVMAASILAKTYRDDLMKEKDKLYPEYGWKDNFGYLNPFHIAAIEKYGPCELHRWSYNPMKSMKGNAPRS